MDRATHLSDGDHPPFAEGVDVRVRDDGGAVGRVARSLVPAAGRGIVRTAADGLTGVQPVHLVRETDVHLNNVLVRLRNHDGTTVRERNE